MGSHRNKSPMRKTTNIYANLDRINKAKAIAEQAIRDRKVYRLDGGHRYIRQALKSRGWVEKFTPKTKRFRVGDQPVDDSSDQKDDQNDEDSGSQLPLDDFDMIVSRALRDHEPDLQFVPHHRIDFNNTNKDVLLNHFPKANFVTKTGLTSCLHDLSWVSDRHSEDFYPRCFILGDADENEAFRDHFRRCAVMSFLKLCSEQLLLSIDENCPRVNTIDSEWINFALEMFNTNYNDANCAQSTISTIKLQVSLDVEADYPKKQWNTFINHFYNVAYKKFVVRGVQAYEGLIHDALRQDEENNPQAFMEGNQNLWIIKPGAMSRGRGIGVYNNLKQITDLLGPDLSIIANNKWVAQKYIERPLLIHGVKFDIRQWFVITDWAQLSIWMYKRSYVRFATTRFTLDRLDTQTHLTNNAIQKNFDLEDDVHQDIPQEKMWFSEELDDYLKQCGFGNVWDQKIIPAFRRILIETCLAGQDTAESRKNSFEIYGADFMLDEQLNPWLIEINQGPTMATSTTVSNELVNSLIEDLCKVVLDRKSGKKANPETSDTGDFEQIYRQTCADCPRYVGNSLNVEGKGLLKPKVKQRTYIRTLPRPSEDDDDETQTRVYSWDIDRINRLAQPRTTMERTKEILPITTQIEKPKPPPPRITAPKATPGTNQMSPSTHNILKKLKEVTKKSDNQRKRPEHDRAKKVTETDVISHSVTKKVGQPKSAREYKVKRVSRPITSQSQHDTGMDLKDHVQAEYRLSTVDDTPVSYAGWDSMNRKIEISKQIAADLQLARKRCDTMIKPIRTNDKPLEHRLLYPIGLTESRFKIQPRTKSKPGREVNSSLRAYRQMSELPNLEMLAHSKVMQSRLSPPKVSLAPTVYPFGDNSMSFGEKSPFQPLPVIMPLSAVLSASHHAPKHVRQGVPIVPSHTLPTHRVEKNTAEPYCIKIPL
jgi:tubulin monoglycylase TTLL3/8